MEDASWQPFLFVDVEEIEPEWLKCFLKEATNFEEGCENCEWYRDNDDTYSCCTEHEGPMGYVSNPEDWGVCTGCGRIDDCQCDDYSECSCDDSICSGSYAYRRW
jgi:hypothetical protein